MLNKQKYKKYFTYYDTPSILNGILLEKKAVLFIYYLFIQGYNRDIFGWT